MEQLTTYRAQGKEVGLVFLFKYDLIGNLKLFEKIDCDLNDIQKRWLYSSNFPDNEIQMLTIWMKDERYTSKFNVVVSPPDLSFETLWELYDYKHDKQEAKKAFNKLTEADKIKCFISVPLYNNWLKNKTIEKIYLTRFISKRRFDDDFSTPTKPGKNYNAAIKQLAELKKAK